MNEEPAERDPLIGETLGGLYRVEHLIGKGGMGRVYAATHIRLGKTYALKVLEKGRADRPVSVQRFLREAQAAARIDNDHIVDVLNFDEHDEHGVFLVMELLEGEDLSKRLHRGALPLEEAIELITQTGDALQAAHDAGILHRDLKPENVFITQKHGRDFVKVLDFGISKIKSPEEPDVKLTQTDQIVGTPLYISPELARGAPEVDHRSDVYALGVLSYEILTGTPPFLGQNRFQLLYMHGSETPDPPSQRNEHAEVPAHVEEAILKALEKDPADRFDSIQDFCAALRAPPAPPPEPAPEPPKPAPPGKRATLRLALALASAVLVVVALSFLGRGPSQGPQPGLPEPENEPEPQVLSSTSKADVASATQPPPRSATIPAQVRIELTSTPRGALVRLDGRRKGKTPLSLDLPKGTEATVRFSMEGYQPKEHRLVVEDDETVRVRLWRKTRPEPPPTPPIKQDF